MRRSPGGTKWRDYTYPSICVKCVKPSDRELILIEGSDVKKPDFYRERAEAWTCVAPCRADCGRPHQHHGAQKQFSLRPHPPQKLPPVELLQIASPTPLTPLGAQRLAEANSIILPPCDANASADALGVSDVRLPATPRRIHALMTQKEAAE